MVPVDCEVFHGATCARTLSASLPVEMEMR
jgi:hypothetical protein